MPTEDDAAQIFQAVLGQTACLVERFPAGLAHYVFDVRTETGGQFVVRLTRAEQAAEFAGAVYWHPRLTSVGVPLPKLLYTDPTGTDQRFPTLILERLPGADLGEVYQQLTREQKHRLAQEIARIQAAVATLPPGPGFGEAHSYEAPLWPRWRDVLAAHLQRSRRQIREVG